MERCQSVKHARRAASCAGFDGLFSVFLVVCGALALAVTATSARASSLEAVLMPFHCSWKAGEPVLTPSLATAYEIVGSRQQRPYTACRDRAGRACATVMVHRFQIQCGERLVAWHRIAPLLRQEGVGLSWIRGGVLNLVGSHKRDAGGAGDASGPHLRMALPAGFAPIGEVGARLAFNRAAEAALREQSPSAHADGGPASDPALLAKVLVPGPSSPESWSTEVSAASPMPPAPAERSMTDRLNAPRVAPAEHAVVGFDVVAIIAVFGGLLIAVGVVAGWSAWRRFYALPHGLAADQASWEGTPLFGAGSVISRGLARFRSSPVLRTMGRHMWSGIGAVWFAVRWALLGPFHADGRPREAGSWTSRSPTGDGHETLDRLFDKTEAQVARLGQGHALHETLVGELRSVRKRFNVNTVLAQDEADAKSTARRQASLVRAAIRDLERIGKIARSAELSLKAGGRRGAAGAAAAAVEMPQTVAEAYQVFGVSETVGDAALKKVVDGLRMSWHPDLAHDDEDRIVRGDRIKQINLAWDLIKAQRSNRARARDAA